FPAAMIVLLAAVLTSVWLGLGVLSLPGLGLLALAAVVGGAAVVLKAPWLLVVLGPTLLPLPIQSALWPVELSTLAFAGLVLVVGVMHRQRWVTRLHDVALAYLAFAAWAVFT